MKNKISNPLNKRNKECFLYKSQLISNKEELKSYLTKEENSYSNFILERIDRKLETRKNSTIHIHHIIPRHFGGPNARWNLIKLFVEEHAHVHQLLYENYKNFYDLSASKMIQGQISEGFALIRKANQLKMKQNQIGFYNLEIQKNLANRPKKKRKPYARNYYIKSALEKGFALEWIKTKKVVEISPLECSSLVEIMEKLMTYSEMSEKLESWKKIQKKEKYYGITALTRTLTGHIDSKTGKSVYSFMGWRVLGLFLISI